MESRDEGPQGIQCDLDSVLESHFVGGIMKRNCSGTFVDSIFPLLGLWPRREGRRVDERSLR